MVFSTSELKILIAHGLLVSIKTMTSVKLNYRMLLIYIIDHYNLNYCYTAFQYHQMSTLLVQLGFLYYLYLGYNIKWTNPNFLYYYLSYKNPNLSFLAVRSGKYLFFHVIMHHSIYAHSIFYKVSWKTTVYSITR